MKLLKIIFLFFLFVVNQTATSQVRRAVPAFSIPTLPSAIPAFIGYTEKIQTRSGQNLLWVPTEISSLRDYQLKYGGASNADEFLLFQSLELYFLNGGTACYIVSIGPYKELHKKDFITGLAKIKEVSPVTLLVFPDAVNLPGDELYEVQRAALEQAATLGNRFCILDLKKATSIQEHQFSLDEFRKHIGTDNLSYGAAYGPYLIVNTTKYIPPAAAIAGIYCKTDKTKGVWKAPANEQITGINGLAVTLTTAAIANMNFDASTGKSINALRLLSKNPVVWGARTIAGDDNEWRYIPVRRFFMVLQNSIKAKMQDFRSASNTQETWIRIKTLINDFLYQKWRDGALLGAQTTEAYFIKLGLGETMTVSDIQNNRIIINYGISVLRPAEFIVGRIVLLLQ